MESVADSRIEVHKTYPSKVDSYRTEGFDESRLPDRPMPMQLIARYAKAAARRAVPEQLEDGSWYAEIRGFPGVWAQGDSEEAVVNEIEEVVLDWTLLKIRDRDQDLPVIDAIDLNVL